MANRNNPSYPAPIHPDSASHLVVLIGLVAALSYLAARVGGALVIRPEMIWPIWPGCAFLVAVLLLTPRKIWPAVLLAGLAGFAVYDVQEALPLRALVYLLVADSIEILVAALGVSYAFGGVPRLTSVQALVKYAIFAVILAPVAVASAAARALDGDSWWVGFLTEALALLTLTPAILGWVDIALTRGRKPKAHYIEAALLWVGLATLAYFTFVASGSQSRPAMLYSLVPFLLWAALRFGITGASSSIVLVAFLAILGAAHTRGPFAGRTPVNDVLSLQLFLLVAGSSFMVLAAVVEQHKAAEQSVRESENRLRLAQQVARIGAFERDVVTGVVTWTPQMEALYGLPPGGFGQTRTAFENLIHPDDRAEVVKLVNEALRTGQPTSGEWRVVWPDGSVHWIAGRWQTLMSDSGEPTRVVGVNMDITDRRLAEEAVLEVNRTLEAQAALLQSREELLKAFVKSVPAGVAMLDRDMRYLQVSDRWCADYSVDCSQVLGRSHYELFPDVPPRWKEMHRRALDGETFRADEDRWDREDGTSTWVRWEIRPWKTPSGIIGGILIFSEDITQSKRAEEALLDISRKLVEAHEQERTRIGRDLHDDVVQRLALLTIELEAVRAELPDSVAEVGRQIGDLRDQTKQIANDVQSLSHELHSSKLDYLGIVGAARNLCGEFGKRYKVEIDFRSHDVPAGLPTGLSLSLFRVLQEALRNATKHSGVKRFEVGLWGSAGEVHLTVSDHGAGFDIEAAMKSTGLGLTSMQERMRLVDGELSINSRPMGGATIHARVPLDSSRDSARAAG